MQRVPKTQNRRKKNITYIFMYIYMHCVSGELKKNENQKGIRICTTSLSISISIY